MTVKFKSILRVVCLPQIIKFSYLSRLQPVQNKIERMSERYC